MVIPPMIRKFVDTVLNVHPVIWVLLYVALQALLYFQPFLHGTAASFYFLAVDPELFPRDLARTSSLGTSTFFYKFMYLLLGPNVTNPFYLFWPYLVTCFLIAYAVYKIGYFVSGGRREAGLLMLVLLLVQKMPINGAFVSLTFADYNYQHFALPIVLFSIYFFLREQYFCFALFMVAAFYFHLKTPAAVLLALLPLLAYEIRRRPKILLSFIFPFFLFIPRVMALAKGFYSTSGFSPAEKAEFMRLIIPREGIEGNVFFNLLGTTNLTVCAVLTLVGVWTVRFVGDEQLRRKFYWCYGGIVFAFCVGLVVKGIDHSWGPLGEISVLGYTRASILGLVLTLSTLAVFFYGQIERAYHNRRTLMLVIYLALLIFVGLNDFYFWSFSDIVRVIAGSKTLAKIIFSLLAAGSIAALVKVFDFRLPVMKVVTMVLIAALGYTAVKGSAKVYQSYKMEYPFFPLSPVHEAFFDKNYYDSQAWAKVNTDKNDLFLVVLSDRQEEGDYCDGGFRYGSLRSVWCQDVPCAYGNGATFREWKRRREVLREFLGKPFDQWDPLVQGEKIDYVVGPKDSVWPRQYAKVYENQDYVIYKTGVRQPRPIRGSRRL